MPGLSIGEMRDSLIDNWSWKHFGSAIPAVLSLAFVSHPCKPKPAAVESCPCNSENRAYNKDFLWDLEKTILKAASITLISLAVVSRPVNAHQSLTIRPALITSEARFTLPAFIPITKSDMRNNFFSSQNGKLTTSGICNKLLNSSWSCLLVRGCTSPPWFVMAQ